MRFSFLFIVLSLLLSNNTFAQLFSAKKCKGYVVTLTGDTMHGMIRKQDEILRQDKVYLSPNSKAEFVYNPNQIKGYVLMDKDSLIVYDAFSLKDIPGENLIDSAFIHRVVSGPVTLFQFYNAVGKNFNSFLEIPFLEFVRKEDGEYFVFDPAEFKAQAFYYFKDCPDVLEKIRKDELKKHQLSKIVSEYNQCKENKQ